MPTAPRRYGIWCKCIRKKLALTTASDLIGIMAPAATADLNVADSSTLAKSATDSQRADSQASIAPRPGSRCYDIQKLPTLKEFAALTSQTTKPDTYPLARQVEKNVPIYARESIDLTNAEISEQLQDEWYHILLHGPGVFVIQGFFRHPTLIDDANAAYAAIIAKETAQSNGFAKGDHFANAATNDRIWNSFSKHCLQDPASFLQYYSNPLFRSVCEAYLGPAYRITAQVNVVKPGGKAQVCHRDFHMGFQTAATASKWPKGMHIASQLLTLQGAVAHTDMPVESGPTRLLPYSQLLESGYLAYRNEDFQKYFLDNYISLPLQKGDAIFFNPALFHAAGGNLTSDFERSANLIQVSSAFGKPMEYIERIPLVQHSWQLLQEKFREEGLSDGVETFLQAVTEGYPFPTNLDRRPPAPSGMAPESETDILRRGLQEGWSVEQAVEALRDVDAANVD